MHHLLRWNTSCRTVKPTRAWEQKPGLLTDTAVREGEDPQPCGEPPNIRANRKFLSQWTMKKQKLVGQKLNTLSAEWWKSSHCNQSNIIGCLMKVLTCDQSNIVGCLIKSSHVTSLTLSAVWWKSSHCNQSNVVGCLMKVLTCDQSNTVGCLMKVLTCDQSNTVGWKSSHVTSLTLSAVWWKSSHCDQSNKSYHHQPHLTWWSLDLGAT